MIDLEELRRAVDEGCVTALEYSLECNRQRLSLLQEVIRLQKRLISEEKRIRNLEYLLKKRRYFFEEGLRDLDRLEAVTI